MILKFMSACVSRARPRLFQLIRAGGGGEAVPRAGDYIVYRRGIFYWGSEGCVYGGLGNRDF